MFNTFLKTHYQCQHEVVYQRVSGKSYSGIVTFVKGHKLRLGDEFKGIYIDDEGGIRIARASEAYRKSRLFYRKCLRTFRNQTGYKC